MSNSKAWWLSRDRWWRQGKAWRRILSDVSALIVSTVAAWISWSHIVFVAALYGHQGWVSNLYPASVDGMMVVGVVAAADDRANGRLTRPWARVATWAGGLLSIAAQVTSAWPYGPVARVIATVPSGTLIIVVEVLARRGRAASGRRRWWHLRRPAEVAVEAPESTRTTTTPVRPPKPTAAASEGPKPRRRASAGGGARGRGPGVRGGGAKKATSTVESTSDPLKGVVLDSVLIPNGGQIQAAITSGTAEPWPSSSNGGVR